MNVTHEKKILSITHTDSNILSCKLFSVIDRGSCDSRQMALMSHGIGVIFRIKCGTIESAGKLSPAMYVCYLIFVHAHIKSSFPHQHHSDSFSAREHIFAEFEGTIHFSEINPKVRAFHGTDEPLTKIKKRSSDCTNFTYAPKGIEHYCFHYILS